MYIQVYSEAVDEATMATGPCLPWCPGGVRIRQASALFYTRCLAYCFHP
jgi:hypothetical protein